MVPFSSALSHAPLLLSLLHACFPGFCVIDNYRKLPIGKYLDIVNLCETEMDDVDRKVKIVGILTGLTDDEVLALPITEFTECCAKAKFLDKQCPENLIPAVSRSYPIGGFVLIPVTDIRKITTAQYIDFKTFEKDKEHKFVEMLSCFLVPRGKEYNEGYDILDVHNAIREEMSVAEVLALLAFFFKEWVGLIRSTLSSSIKDAMRIEDKETREKMLKKIRDLQDSMTSGGGSTA